MMDEVDRVDGMDRRMRPRRPTYPEIAANAALALLAVACSLLDRQIAAQSKAFEKEGGFTERMYRVRHRPQKIMRRGLPD